MNDTLSDEKKLYHVLQNIPVAIHSCCLNARRENDSMPCQCGDTIINDTMSRLIGYSKRDIELRFHNRSSLSCYHLRSDTLGHFIRRKAARNST